MISLMMMMIIIIQWIPMMMLFFSIVLQPQTDTSLMLNVSYYLCLNIEFQWLNPVWTIYLNQAELLGGIFCNIGLFRRVEGSLNFWENSKNSISHLFSLKLRKLVLVTYYINNDIQNKDVIQTYFMYFCFQRTTLQYQNQKTRLNLKTPKLCLRTYHYRQLQSLLNLWYYHLPVLLRNLNPNQNLLFSLNLNQNLLPSLNLNLNLLLSLILNLNLLPSLNLNLNLHQK